MAKHVNILTVDNWMDVMTRQINSMDAVKLLHESVDPQKLWDGKINSQHITTVIDRSGGAKEYKYFIPLTFGSLNITFYASKTIAPTRNHYGDHCYFAVKYEIPELFCLPVLHANNIARYFGSGPKIASKCNGEVVYDADKFAKMISVKITDLFAAVKEWWALKSGIHNMIAAASLPSQSDFKFGANICGAVAKLRFLSNLFVAVEPNSPYANEMATIANRALIIMREHSKTKFKHSPDPRPYFKESYCV